MTAEKKARQEIDELKEHIKSLKESERKEKRKLADGDALKKIKRHEDQIAELKKDLAHQKQVGDPGKNAANPGWHFALREIVLFSPRCHDLEQLSWWPHSGTDSMNICTQ